MLVYSLRRAALGSLLGVAAIGLGASPALAQSGHGHHPAIAHHAKKKKSKGSTGPKVTVHCASIGVSCKGTPGPKGATGPAGTNGAAGLNGLDGARIVARVSSAGASSTAPETSCTSIIICPLVPLNGASWTEGPTEDDQFYGLMTVSLPSQEECGYKKGETTYATVISYVEVDGKIEGVAEIKGEENATQKTLPIFFNIGFIELESSGSSETALFGTGFLMSNGASQPHTMTLLAVDNCKGGTHPVLNSVAIDVFGMQ